ncbi:hypothetical protein M8C21_016380, partial [Ambrosia artemisiifolia]
QWIDLARLKTESANPTTFGSLWTALKALSRKEVHYGSYATPEHVAAMFSGKQYLQFVGVVEMIGSVDYEKNLDFWCLISRMLAIAAGNFVSGLIWSMTAIIVARVDDPDLLNEINATQVCQMEDTGVCALWATGAASPMEIHARKLVLDFRENGTHYLLVDNEDGAFKAGRSSLGLLCLNNFGTKKVLLTDVRHLVASAKHRE